MKIKLIIILIFFTNILLGQGYENAEFLKIKGTHCAGPCCVFDKTYFFLPNNHVVKRMDVSDYDNHSLIGTYTFNKGIIKMTFNELIAGVGISYKTPSMNGCSTYDYDLYISFCKEINEEEIIDLNKLPDDGEYGIDSIKIKDYINYNWITQTEIISFTNEELSRLNERELRLKRNEIFARYGYKFKSDDLNEYFKKMDWYKPKYTDVKYFLTVIDKKNIELILSFEKKLKNN